MSHIEIARSFQDLSEDEIAAAERDAFIAGFHWHRPIGWTPLLKSRRILLLSEAGVGKTHETQGRQRSLWNEGEAALLAELAKSDLRSLLTPDEEERLDAWKNGKLDVATFFLDSIDELNFTQGSFRTALTRIAKEIRGNDARTCIMVTARPVPFDRQLFERLLPFPPTEHEVTDEDFARAAMGEKASAHKSGATQDEAPTNRTVTLLPFSNEQIVAFARASGVEDADALDADLMKRDALDFARRPQDLIELCSAWQAKDRIDTHQAQVRNDIITKLLPRTGERKERAPLSPEKAFDGAARLCEIGSERAAETENLTVCSWEAKIAP